MRVTLENHTQNPDKAITHACRTCYQSYARQNEDSDAKLLAHLIQGESCMLYEYDLKVCRLCVHLVNKPTPYQCDWHRYSEMYCNRKNIWLYSDLMTSEAVCKDYTPASQTCRHKHGCEICDININGECNRLD